LAAAVTDNSGGAADGNRAGWLTLTNTSSASCDVYGYPAALALKAADGTPIPTIVDPYSAYDGLDRLITLVPGASAHVLLQWSAVPAADEPQQGACEPQPATIAVTPPDGTSPIDTTWPAGPVCDHGTIHTAATS
jgi:hypothetical protein